MLVELYSADRTPGIDAPVADMRTSNGGFYRFGNLGTGDYIVHVPTPPTRLPASSTRTSTIDNGEDLNDNGTQIVIGGAATGPVIALAVGDEPTLEPEEDALDDANGDVTIDFGFYRPAEALVGLGNLVWHDANNDGSVNGDEEGIDGVRVCFIQPTKHPVPTCRWQRLSPAKADATASTTYVLAATFSAYPRRHQHTAPAAR